MSESRLPKANLNTVGRFARRKPSVRELMPLVYKELKALAQRWFRNQPPGHTLQPTALVHEVFLRLAKSPQEKWKDPAHFYAVAATAMHQVLADYCRGRNAAKRGGGWLRITLDEVSAPSGSREVDALDLAALLDKLAELDRRQCQIVEMRTLGGCSVAEIAAYFEVSTRTVEREWRMAQAWLVTQLERRSDKNEF